MMETYIVSQDGKIPTVIIGDEPMTSEEAVLAYLNRDIKYVDQQYQLDDIEIEHYHDDLLGFWKCGDISGIFNAAPYEDIRTSNTGNGS